MLRFKQFLKEFAELPIIYAQKTANVKTDNGVKQVPYSELVKLNAISREKRNQNITYLDDHRYNDDDGRLWLDVKHKDFDTIALAVLTGMYDTKRIKKNPATMTQDEFDSILMDPVVNSKVNQVWTFLSDYMSKGTVTVYRGINLDNIIFELLEKDPRIMRNINFILPYIDNTTKEFNSFSVRPTISSRFAKAGKSYVIIQADVDNNDVRWAFTAYIMGRHGGIGEHELNINNNKRLKNLKVYDYNILVCSEKLRQKLKQNNIDKNLVEIKGFAYNGTRMVEYSPNSQIYSIDKLCSMSDVIHVTILDEEDCYRNLLLNAKTFEPVTKRAYYEYNTIDADGPVLAITTCYFPFKSFNVIDLHGNILFPKNVYEIQGRRNYVVGARGKDAYVLDTKTGKVSTKEEFLKEI